MAPAMSAMKESEGSLEGMARILDRPPVTLTDGLRGDTCLRERVKFDLDYIENWNFVLDFQIMLMTLYKRGGAC